MEHPLEKKRATYLNVFKDGVADALLDGNMDEEKRSSSYYKQGYDFGLTMWNELYEDTKWERKVNDGIEEDV